MTDPGRKFVSLEDLPRTIPVFPLTGALLLPRARLPLHIFEPRYLAMVDHALAGSRVIGMIQPRPGQEMALRPELYPVGCLGRITSFNETEDSRYFITLGGLCRFRPVEELSTVTPYRQLTVDYTPFAGDLRPAPDADAVDREALGQVLRNYLRKRQLEADWDTINQAPCETLINSLAIICPFEPPEKQALIEALTLADRARALTALIEMAIAEEDDGGSDMSVN
ncbi:MAG: LON peptidase substrate-binding domain-containing protein [Alphaproteobacteria bacterium]|nr:LON peptidase substrate-binding domain-containing protein [Alphaproteobacteria bacterium]